MPHYENRFKHWMTGALKRIDHAMYDEAKEFADTLRECGKIKNQDIGDQIHCTEGELEYENKRVKEIRELKLAELKDENDGWDLRKILDQYITAAPALHSKMDWNKIKNDEVHLEPSDMPDLSIAAIDWLKQHHRNEF